MSLGYYETYFDTAYDCKGRFCSYWHQINEITKLRPGKVLEIGLGNGFVFSYLRVRGIDVTNLDVDRDLRPTVVGNALKLPFVDRSFNVTACYEVLEHLPYGDFEGALLELARVSRSHVLLSVPDVTRVYRLSIQFPKIGEIKQLILLPRLREYIHRFDGQHMWEIGKAGYSLKRIQGDIERAGLRVLETYRVFEFPYHRFFVTSKIQQGERV